MIFDKAEGYMKVLKGIHEKPSEKFDMDLATEADKTRSIKLYGLLASLMRGRALQLVESRTPMDLMPGRV